MLLELFVGLLFFSLALLFYGFYSRTDIFRLIGITLIFFLGVGLSPTMPDQIGGVEYQTGMIETVNGSTTTTTYLFSEYKSHTLSFYMVAFALLTFFIIMMDRKDYDN
jgi:hypothetical protein